MFECVNLVARALTDVVGVVAAVHRINVPQVLLIERTEQNEFDDDAAPPCLGNEQFQTIEVSRFKCIEIEALGVFSRSFGPSLPGGQITVGQRSEGIVLDPERPRYLTVRAAKGAGLVETVARKGVEIR